MDRAERYLASLTEEGRYRLLIEAVTDYAIFLLDPLGIVTTWNPGAQRFKGYRPDEIIGEHFSRFYTEQDQKAGLPARALDAAKHDGRFETEGWRVRKDGSQFWAYVVIDLIRAPSGDIIGFAKITRDLTERREAENKLEKAREFSLQAQKLEAIGQLTGGIAHDFNNLLTAVLGSLELLRKRLPADPKSTALLENAVQGAQRGTTLTKRMLAFARNYELNKEVIGIPELVRGMTDLLQRSVGPSYNLETRFPLSLKAVEVDVNQLELALLNLTLNARDAMPDGGSSRSRRKRCRRSQRVGSWQIYPRQRGRYGRRHGRRNAAQSNRAILYDKGNRQRHRPWPLNGARICRTKRRAADPVQRERQGYDRRALVAGRQNVGATGRPRPASPSKINPPAYDSGCR